MVAMLDRGFPAKDRLEELTSRQAHALCWLETAEANSWECVHQVLRDQAKPHEALATIRVPAAEGADEIRQIRVNPLRRSECGRGQQVPETQMRGQISYANLGHVCARLMAQIVAGSPIAATLVTSERSHNWLGQTA